MMFCHRAAVLHDFVPSLLGGRNGGMKRIRIIHTTEYFYNQPVTFGPHRAMMRPREGHDAHIASARANVEPKAEVRWLRDIYDNSIAILTFEAASEKLSIASEVDVDLYSDNLNEWPIAPSARCFPFQYPAEEQVDLMVYRLPSYPYDGPTLLEWPRDLYEPGQVINTLELLNNLNTHIYRSFIPPG
jgi:Bacterial transglutaminase-like N-terminal region